MRRVKILTISIIVIGISLSLTSCIGLTKKKQALPNIVFILADDLGYGDVSALNPNSKILTPNIDQLSNEGITFTDAHSNSSVCTPTRYGILTGQYAWRSRIKKGVLLGYSPSLIEESTTTVAKLLQGNGYNTACIVKWNLGINFKLIDGTYLQGEPGIDFTQELIRYNQVGQIDFNKRAKGGPVDAGFDYSYILPASLDFEPYMYMENNKAVEAPTEWTNGNCLNTGYTGAFWRKGNIAPSFKFEEVLPTFTQKATDFIQKQKNSEKPFFLYFPMNAPHTPWVPTNDFKKSSKVGEYGDFVQMVDNQVGQILRVLKENGMDQNTIIFFTSDNGAYWKPEFIEQFNHKSNFIFKGMKSDVWEGGHHIPFIVKWQNKIVPRSKSDQIISLTDFFDTVRELVKEPVSSKPEDSFSILPILVGTKESNNRPPVIHHSGGGKFGIRDGRWKLIEGLGSGGFSEPKFPEPKPDEPHGQLYDLNSDPIEEDNLFKKENVKVEELQEKLKNIRGY